MFKLLTYQNFIITNLSAALEVSQFILLLIMFVILRLSNVGFFMDIIELSQAFSPSTTFFPFQHLSINFTYICCVLFVYLSLLFCSYFVVILLFYVL